MSSTQGRPGKDARLVIGSVIIKHKLNLSAEETVLQIQENPYLQYFLEFSTYSEHPLFTPTLFVEIRKRMGGTVFSSFEQVFPNSIDELYQLSNLKKKPRTYRQQARKRYLAISKNRKPGGKLRRKAIREQLQYLQRNFRHIEKLLALLINPVFPLSHKRQRQYWIIQYLYYQQFTMYQGETRRCDNRIVSISQPHVRPIVRGKACHRVEFGSKIIVSMVDGIARVDHFGWDAFNESTDLCTQIESYKKQYGYYAEVVLADGIYGTRANRQYMKKRHIRFGGKPLGRPKKQTVENAEQLKQEKLQRKQDALERIPIEAWINSIFLVMDLMVLFRICYAQFTKTLGFIHLSLFAKILAKCTDWFVSAKTIKLVAG